MAPRPLAKTASTPLGSYAPPAAAPPPPTPPLPAVVVGLKKLGTCGAARALIAAACALTEAVFAASDAALAPEVAEAAAEVAGGALGVAEWNNDGVELLVADAEAACWRTAAWQGCGAAPPTPAVVAAGTTGRTAPVAVADRARVVLPAREAPATATAPAVSRGLATAPAVVVVAAAAVRTVIPALAAARSARSRAGDLEVATGADVAEAAARSRPGNLV